MKVFFSLILGYLLVSFKNDEPVSDVFLDLESKETVKVYKDPYKKKIIKILRHDFKNEDYLTFTIYRDNDSMYYVNASHAIAGKNIQGWISKKTSIKVFSKSYSKPFLLYKSPSENSSSVRSEYTSSALEIFDFEKGWLKVKIKNKKGSSEGWILPQDQCGNPYTTCN